jgi:hypothetical protein
VTMRDHDPSSVPSIIRIVVTALSVGLGAAGVILAFAATGPLWAKILSGTVLLISTVGSLAYAAGFAAGARCREPRSEP